MTIDVFTQEIGLNELKSRVCDELHHRMLKSNISMLPCFSLSEKKHTSHDRILAIDFGGSTIRVAGIQMPNEIIFQKSWLIENKRVDWLFFEEITGKIVDIVRSHDPVAHWPRCGITFSFPVDENNRVKGMGKGFEVTPEIMECSLMDIFHIVFEKHNFPTQVTSIINDSVAVYLADTKVDLSLILGTGINSCFLVNSMKLPEHKKGSYHVANDIDILLNSELGFLGAEYIQLTEFDFHGTPDMIQTLEYVTSGQYLPNILNRVLEKKTGYGIPGLDGKKFVALSNGDMTDCIGLDVELISETVNKILERASFILTGVLLGVAEFLKLQHEPLVVGYVGSFFEKCSIYRKMVSEKSQNRIQFKLLENSNLYGAALAAVHT